MDPQTDLLDAPGSLMIDVFIRGNYTTDSNAMLVGFLREFADAEEAVGNTTRAVELRSRADHLAEVVNEKLWAKENGQDHYITQLNPDGTTRDFVDYDANLIALAHGIPKTKEQARKVLERIDQGPPGTTCTAAKGGGPQYVSEVFYGKSDTTHGNTGDSNCSMGRIAWFDSHARKIQGTPEALEVFNEHLLGPMQRDTIAKTWLGERYNCEGDNYRTPYYFEYPSTTAMLLREIRYGIDLGLLRVTISPFGSTVYNFHVGNIHVDYSRDQVRWKLPGTDERSFRISGMEPNVVYELNVGGPMNNDRGADFASSCSKVKRTSIKADAGGMLQFTATLGAGCPGSVISSKIL